MVKKMRKFILLAMIISTPIMIFFEIVAAKCGWNNETKRLVFSIISGFCFIISSVCFLKFFDK